MRGRVPAFALFLIISLHTASEKRKALFKNLFLVYNKIKRLEKGVPPL
jgi:hypothetical protein